MENTRENTIRKIAHVREWISEDFLFRSNIFRNNMDIMFHNIDHMIHVLTEWLMHCKPCVRFCNVRSLSF